VATESLIFFILAGSWNMGEGLHIAASPFVVCSYRSGITQGVERVEGVDA